MTPARRLLAWTSAFALLLLLFLTAGEKLAIAIIAGALLTVAIWVRPVWGLVAMIVTGVSIPFLVSAAALGMPISVTQSIALLVVGSLIHWSMTQRLSPTWSPSMSALLAFIAVVLLSVAVQPDRLHSTEGALLYARTLLFVVVVAGLGFTRNNVTIIAITVAGAMTLSVFLGLSEYVFDYTIPSVDTERASQTGATPSTFSYEDATPIKRISGGTGTFNWMAYTVAITLPLYLWLWQRTHRFHARLTLAVLTMLALLALALTYTRSGFIGLGAAGTYLVYKRRIPVWVPVGILALATVTAPLWMPDRFADRMLSAEYLNRGTTTIRRDFILDGLAMVSERPLFGYGYAQFGRLFMERSKSQYVDAIRQEIRKGGGTEYDIRAHNMYVELAVDYGLIGLAVFMTVIVLTIMELRTVERLGDADQANLAVALTAGLIAFLVCGIFGHINIMKLPLILVGLSAALQRSVLSSHSGERCEKCNAADPTQRTRLRVQRIDSATTDSQRATIPGQRQARIPAPDE